MSPFQPSGHPLAHPEQVLLVLKLARVHRYENDFAIYHFHFLTGLFEDVLGDAMVAWQVVLEHKSVFLRLTVELFQVI